MKNKTDTQCSLSEQNRKLALQWHPVKNAPLTPKDVTANSGKKVRWLCAKGHEWQSTIANRTKGTGCPYCAGKKATKETCLRTVNPKLARQWHQKRNSPLTPMDVLPHSNNKVWWVCQRNHEWEAVIDHRNRGVGCPYCSGRRATKESCLQAVYPALARQGIPQRIFRLRQGK